MSVKKRLFVGYIFIQFSVKTTLFVVYNCYSIIKFILKTSMERIMAQIGLKPYRPQLIHGLLEDDSDRRLQFSEQMLNKIEKDSGILDKIIWSDEASFKLSGHVNRHNCVYWYTNNMHLTLEKNS